MMIQMICRCMFRSTEEVGYGKCPNVRPAIAAGLNVACPCIFKESGQVQAEAAALAQRLPGTSG